MSTLDLALIGNGTTAALVDGNGTIVWACVPRFDGDPAFCSLVRGDAAADGSGSYAVELVDFVRAEQEYVTNTPILATRLYDRGGACAEVIDFAPRFRQHERIFCPMTLIRRIRRLAGNPRIRIRLRPMRGYGREEMPTTFGSNHIRYNGDDVVLRLTTNAPVSAILEENVFLLDEDVTLHLGPDETVPESLVELGRRMFDLTVTEWRDWVRSLAIPFEWQDEVIRAAITLKLNVFEDTGAIIAAVTSSIPEAPHSGRNWDYRYCWLRDAYFVINALNRLGATRTMERYLSYVLNIIADAEATHLKPMYRVTGQPVPDEYVAEHLSGYRGMGPVRVGNDAHAQIQHDVYGSAILITPHAFFDRRLISRGDEQLFQRLEWLGRQSVKVFDEPDSGIWELRGTSRVHTFSAIMCWAGCDRLARIARHLGLRERAAYWAKQAKRIHTAVYDWAWNEKFGAFMATKDGGTLDASLLRMPELGFTTGDDPRFVSTVRAIEHELQRGDLVFRYTEPDDFGTPETAFVVCTFWYINALVALGERDKARELFESVLRHRNRHGLLAEDIDPATGEQWGNYVQTYSMVGIIDAATRLSEGWEQAY
jgi:GH15 family glucan-1,4-alpha-glucosidase